jgi:flagellar biosynthesis protein FlhG
MTSEIWAIGGGKGGTGKSFVTSTLGMNLAYRGKNITLIDADLGGANLHTFLKIKKPRYSLTDFFEKKIPLSDIIRPTEIPNLRFVTGDVRSLDSTGVRYTQKLKLYRHIKNISGDYVLIDLGAGSGHNTIDTFLIADKMIVVTLPEITAIENLYMFIKKVLFRKLNQLLGDHGLKDAARKAWQHRKTKDIKNIKQLIQHIKDISPEIKTLVEKTLSQFRLYIIMNEVKNNQQIEMGFSTKSVLHKYFEIDARYVGYVHYNEFFWKFVKESATFRQITSPASTSAEMRSIVQHLVNDKQLKLAEIANDE